MSQLLSLKARAIALLAQREHSAAELRRKLLRMARERDAKSASRAESADADTPASPAAEIEQLLTWLQAQGYLNEPRFIESRIHARAARHGNLRIRQELAQHGLTLDASQAEALKSSEFDRAKAIWQRKFGSQAEDATGLARQMRFLTGRGFSAEVIRRLMRDPEGD